MGENTKSQAGPTGVGNVAFSNGVRLTGKEWLGVGFFVLALVLGAPSLWRHLEKFDLEPDYRMPYDLSQDYWLFNRYAHLAAEQYDTLLLGDSVVWGQYVTRGQTLSHYLNDLAGSERFANLGLDGAHPAALAGLIEHYADSVRGKNVVLHCNLLWMSSPRQDLEVDPELPFNHPRLVAQFVPHIPRYRENASNRIGILVEQRVPFCSWTNHLQQAYFDRSDIPSWTLEHPYDDPIKPLTQGLPPSDNVLRHEPVSWTKRGIKKQDFDWVEPETSLQWRFFRTAVETLERRGNRVTVVVGPFNEQMLTKKGLDGYLRVHAHVVSWLEEKGLPHVEPAALPSEEYADASHPLAAGYSRLARELWSRLAP